MKKKIKKNIKYKVIDQMKRRKRFFWREEKGLLFRIFIEPSLLRNKVRMALLAYSLEQFLCTTRRLAFSLINYGIPSHHQLSIPASSGQSKFRHSRIPWSLTAKPAFPEHHAIHFRLGPLDGVQGLQHLGPGI